MTLRRRKRSLCHSDPANPDLKLLCNADGSRAELYNVTADVFETNNLAAAMPETVATLSRTVITWALAQPQSPPESVQIGPGCGLHIAREGYRPVTVEFTDTLPEFLHRSGGPQ